MSKFRTNPATPPFFAALATALVVLSATLIYLPTAHRAWAAPLQVVPNVSVMVPAGGTAYLQVKGLSLQPNEGIPSGPLVLATPALAPDLLRTTLYYGIDWGYTETDPRQVALAIWWAQDNVWYAGDHATAERIANAAVSSPGTPSWNPGGQSLLVLVAQGQVSPGELALTASSQLPALGTGTLALHNGGQQDYLVYLPYGTVFTSAAGPVIVWAVSAGSAPATPQEGTPAPAPTSTPIPTPTFISTATATPALATPTTTYKQGAEPTPQQSPLPSYKASPPPATLAPTETPQVEPTATSAPSASTLTPTATTTSERTGATQSPSGGAQASGQQHGSVPGEQANAATDLTTTKPGDLGVPTDRQNAANVSVPPLPSTPNVNSTPYAASPTPGGTNRAPSMPSPVGTSASNPGAGIPPAQATTQATVSVPAPIATGASQIPTPTGGTIKPTPTSFASPSGGLANNSSAEATQTARAVSDTANNTPTLAPTPVPQPVPTTSGKEAETPVIIVNPEDQKQQTPISPPLQGNLAGGATTQGSQGSPPTNTPTTGGGPSTLPVWLALAGVLLVAGGWGLRRASHRAMHIQGIARGT